MTKPDFDIEYEEGATAPFVDWVAGGNFNGYIHKKFLEIKISTLFSLCHIH
jgi:hypothetical protein